MPNTITLEITVIMHILNDNVGSAKSFNKACKNLLRYFINPQSLNVTANEYHYCSLFSAVKRWKNLSRLLFYWVRVMYLDWQPTLWWGTHACFPIEFVSCTLTGSQHSGEGRTLAFLLSSCHVPWLAANTLVRDCKGTNSRS